MMVRRLGVVALQKVFTEVTARRPPDRVNVVRSALGAVVFDQDGRSVDAVIMWLPWIDPARPGEVQPVHSRIDQLRHLIRGDWSRGVADIRPDQSEEKRAL